MRKKQSETTARQLAADQIRRDWERYTEEMQWEAQRKRKYVDTETDNMEFEPKKSNQAVVRIKWAYTENAQANACYTESFLKTCLSEFGEVTAFVFGKRGSGIAEFSKYKEAKNAIEASESRTVGLPSLPLHLSWLSDNDTNTDKEVNNNSDRMRYQEAQRSSSMNDPMPNKKTNFDTFEQDILSRMASFGQ
ncbi:unnamed protein product [Heterobilharzia americana]|nr:unnamed protein product [Heterobilharzia americana]